MDAVRCGQDVFFLAVFRANGLLAPRHCNQMGQLVSSSAFHDALGGDEQGSQAHQGSYCSNVDAERQSHGFFSFCRVEVNDPSIAIRI
jgi:hypothetical protein